MIFRAPRAPIAGQPSSRDDPIEDWIARADQVAAALGDVGTFRRDARRTVKVSKARPRDDGAPQVDIAVPAFGDKNHISIDRRHGLTRTDGPDRPHHRPRPGGGEDRTGQSRRQHAPLCPAPQAKCARVGPPHRSWAVDAAPVAEAPQTTPTSFFKAQWHPDTNLMPPREPRSWRRPSNGAARPSGAPRRGGGYPPVSGRAPCARRTRAARRGAHPRAARRYRRTGL